MPSTMTHSYFACDVYDKLDKKSKNNISSLDNFKLYSQGVDPFMFYNFLIGKKAKYYAKLQGLIHTTRTREYFTNIIKYIIDNDYANNKELMTFLYGNICHYYLDMNVHPFIYYKTGKYKRSDKRTYKYNGKHQDMEYGIDKYLIKERANTDVKEFKIHKEIFGNYNISLEVTDCIDYVIGKTYNVYDTGKIYNKSVKMMRQFFYLFNYDRFGIKKYIYSLLDIIRPDCFIKIKELSYADNDINMNYLNLDRKIWNHPCDMKEKYNYSFWDLYNMSIEQALDTIKKVNLIIEKKNIKMIKDVFKNYSYVTGKDCNLELELKYFEY
ncbi:MAG: zinc dependent phospholipase C family protein [Bacilli bacterium]|nr:zinc dependent phospholipase C family protein [Bacilli bacterium]